MSELKRAIVYYRENPIELLGDLLGGLAIFVGLYLALIFAAAS